MKRAGELRQEAPRAHAQGDVRARGAEAPYARLPSPISVR